MTGDPLWYKDAILYELHVRAFYDSDGDGIGDFAGLTEKLDYLEDLGVNTLWLLPFYPSPLKDDGYDISDYTNIHPSYGTLADFKTFLDEAHRRGLRVVTELILNHTSDRHPWFQRSRRAAPGDPARDWYVWSKTTDRYRDARVIFPDFEPSNWTWDETARAYYWHRFYSHQPDLNFEHPQVHEAILGAVDFWLQQGVDGFRLDAIPYLYERDGTSCENLPETHAFLKKLRRHIDSRYPDRLLLAEANQWPEDAVAYFGQGDECNMAFHFPIMTRLFLSVHMEDRYPMVDILNQTPALPESAQWALFLRNHDELTLEMVTDQERDYMYRVYAQDATARINLGIRRRLAPLLQNDRKKIELLNALLFSLPGTPVIYYGDEIGMGDNFFLGDRNGVRTPMQWSGDRNAGFSRANAQRLYLPLIVDPEYHYEAVNVEAQQGNPHSLLWWTKRLLALSRRFKAFGRGTFELLAPANRKILAYLRRYQDEVILVVANLSRFSQYVELDLRSMKGGQPVELFGRTPFPRIGESPYLLTLGPHSFYWFAVEQPRETVVAGGGEPLRTLEVAKAWTELLTGKPKQGLEVALNEYLHRSAWFTGRAKVVRAVRIQETIRLPLEGLDSVLALAVVDYIEGESETYSIPLLFTAGTTERPDPIAAVRFRDGGTDGILSSALADDEWTRAWIRTLTAARPIRTAAGRVHGVTAPAFRNAGDLSGFHLKWYRQLQDGENPELEVARFLAEQSLPPPVPAYAGSWEYARRAREPLTLALLQEEVPQKQDGWTQAWEGIDRYFETIRSQPTASGSSGRPRLSSRHPQAASPEVVAALGPYLESVRKAGECIARLHRALASGTDRREFAPEPFTAAQQANAFQALRRKVGAVLADLRAGLRDVPGPVLPAAERILGAESLLLQSFQRLLRQAVGSIRIRCHGDLNLHNLLSAGSDFTVINLPGPATSPFIDRRIKRSPFWDVASMVQSFHAVAALALADQESRGEVAPERWPSLEQGAAAWLGCVTHTFVAHYLAGVTFGEPLEAPLLCSLLERALDELGVCLRLRRDRLAVSVQGLADLLDEL